MLSRSIICTYRSTAPIKLHFVDKQRTVSQNYDEATNTRESYRYRLVWRSFIILLAAS